jgi:hypothetical protein
MDFISTILAWAQSFGVGGAFFIITLGAFGVCGMALWVVLVALNREKTK